MLAFKDKTGRTWEVELTFGAIRRIRAALKIDLQEIVEEGKPLNSDLFASLIGDIEKVIDVVFLICAAQAQRENIDANAFADLLSGDTILEMRNALVEAIVLFSQGRRREVLRLMVETIRSATEQAHAKAISGLKSIDFDQLLATSRAKSGSSPESSASIPTPLPSASLP